jgi:hypothetical protein
MALRIKDPKAGDWDYSGCCAPGVYMSSYLTFSVGIFQWVPYADGKGIKHGKVVKRISGFTRDPKDVYDRAEYYIQKYLEKSIRTGKGSQ